MTDSWRGHHIYEDEIGAWAYADGTLVSADPDRACAHCGLANTPEGHDGCLGTIPGVAAACCGHGIASDAYVVFTDRREKRGQEAVAFFDREKILAEVTDA